MSGLAELERAKRRRLQQAYTDLRPLDKGNDDERQAKLRNLMLGAAADASLPPSGSSSRSQSSGALAAAAAASINGVEITHRRVTSNTVGSGSGSGGVRRQWSAASGSAAVSITRAPPPGPMDGGFLPESDPVQRLSQLPLPIGGGGCGGTTAGVPPGRGSAAAGGACPPSHLAGVHSGRSGHGAGAAEAVTAAAAAVPPVAAAQFNPFNCDTDDADVALPSDVELALISVKSDLRSHPGSADLPPMALRSHLSCLLADRLTVERQLDEQRRANRVRVFKLPTGADEFGILMTADYRTIVREAANNAVRDQRGGVPSASPCGAYGAPGSAASTADGSSPWHEAVEAFLNRVVDRCTEFELSRSHLIYLMQSALQPSQRSQPTQPPPPQQLQQSQHQHQHQHQQHQHQQGSLLRDHKVQKASALGGRGEGGGGREGGGGSSAASSRSAQVSLEAAEEQISLLLHLGCIARHTDGDADAFVLAVPGVGKLVKSVLGGRRELLTWLSKTQHQEAAEERVCKLKLRCSCLPPTYHVKDLEGRGAVKRLETACGPVVRLPGRRGKPGH